MMSRLVGGIGGRGPGETNSSSAGAALASEWMAPSAQPGARRSDTPAG
jgi:hypothetical protein